MSRFSALLIVFFSLQVSAYNIDKTQVSVSGLSSGAYMAGQVHVAFSNIFMGVGIIAGGPYYCAKNDAFKAQMECMGAPMGPPAHQDAVAEARRAEKTKQISPLKSLSSARVYILTGKNDEVVVRSVADEAIGFYKQLGVKAADIEYVTNLTVGHAFPTVDYGNSCEERRTPPFINSCNYDTAGALFNHIYGQLKPAVEAKKQSLHTLAQKKYLRVAPAELSLNDKAFAYVPEACDQGAKCRLHFAFHGCKQTTDDIGDQFYTKTGYNEWAEANNIIVVYPQTIRTSMMSGNPNGCWDWWGYTSSAYHTQEAPQMQMISQMVEDFSLSKMR
ncbi:MAG: PHB depolymerase family esterase, partial [Bdellovibrionota bacterium]